ncbi:hypothetical protein TWF281_007484 [Arthrobotrys megalospora]
MPPSFGDKEYWDSRFTSNPSTFDWLLPATPLTSSINSAITSSPSLVPQILHIGCGTSDLSFHLKTLVKTPAQIHNVDFSNIAVEMGRSKDGTMNWSTLDLLNLQQVLEFQNISSEGGYTLVVDKSTADAISCAEDVVVELPYRITSNNDERTSAGSVKIHPLAVLSIHLAYLTAPGANWLLLSYSNSRCDFLTSENPGERIVDEKVLDKGFIDPRLLWKVVKEEALDAPEESGGSDRVVGRPVVKHTLYTLERTDFNLMSR